MDESVRAQIETYLTHLEGLKRRGRELRDALAANPSTHRQSPPLAAGRKIAA